MEIREQSRSRRGSICQELLRLLFPRWTYLASWHVTLLELSRWICSLLTTRDSHPPRLGVSSLSVSLPSQETLTGSPCQIRLSCSLQFACPPLPRARFRRPQALGNARLPLDPRRRTDVARHRESHTGMVVMSPALKMSARLNGSDCSRSEFASMRRRKPRASR